jgi:transposase
MINLMTRRDARSLDHATLQEMRRLGVRRVLAGETQVDVARSLEVNHHAVKRWIAAYRKGGEQALARRKAPGAKPKLGPKQTQRLQRIILGKNPHQLNFGPALWTLPLVGQLITRLFGLVLDTTTVWRLLRRLGLTPQKPARRAFQRNDAAIRHWCEAEFPAIVRAAKRRQATLMFLDETGVQEDHAVGTTWGQQGQTPVVAVTGSRKRINVISAISPRGRLWFRCFKGTLKAVTFVDFLRDLLHDTSKPIDLILDRHPSHMAGKVQRFIHEQRDRLRVHWLPAYAPELNPDEHVWSLLKGLFRRNPLHRDEDLRAAVEDELVHLKNDERRVRAFFEHPEVRYIAKALSW